MREIILAEIRRIAEANGGKAPGATLFRTATGIGEAKWRGVYWARWGDALADAGYAANDWQAKLDSAELLGKLAAIVNERGAFPTYSELVLMRRTDASIPNPKTLRHHFGGQAGIVAALRSYCDEHEGFEGVRSALPEVAERPRPERHEAREGWVYLLKSGQHYKIGRSDQLEARVKQISIALPETTSMVHAIRTDDPPGIEAYWHRRFADKRANGEWFALSGEDVRAFCKRNFM